MFCEQCGAQLSETARFCTGCGAKVETTPFSKPSPAQSGAYVPAAEPSAAPAPASPTSSGAKPRKIGLIIGLAVGGALLLGALVFLGARLLGKAKPDSNAVEQPEAYAAAEERAPGEGAALPALPAYSIPEAPPPSPPAEGPAQAPPQSPPLEAPAVAVSEEAALLGTWLGEPDEDGWCALMHIGEEMLGEGFAIVRGAGNAGVEHYPDGFAIRAFTWSEWGLEDGAFFRIWEDGEKDSFAYSLLSQDLLELESDFETYTYRRVPAQQGIPLIDFLSGSWVSEDVDENGYRLAFQFDTEDASDCQVFVVKTKNDSVVYGDWLKNDWEYGDRHEGQFALAGNSVSIRFPSGSATDRTYEAEVVDAWRIILARDGYRNVFHRMDWLGTQ